MEAFVIFCWLFKWLSDKLPSSHTDKAQNRKGGDLKDEPWWLLARSHTSANDIGEVHNTNESSSWWFMSLDLQTKRLGFLFLERFKGQPTKTNSACFPWDFLLNNMKQIHLRPHHRLKTLCLVIIKETPSKLSIHYLNSYIIIYNFLSKIFVLVWLQDVAGFQAIFSCFLFCVIKLITQISKTIHLHPK